MSVPLDFDTTVPTLVFKIGQYAIHHGTLGIIRSLGRMGVPVYAIVEDHLTPAAVSRYLTGAFKWDTRGLDAERLLTGLATIGARLGRPAILLPTDDPAATFVAEHSEALANWFLFPHVPAELPRRLTNKKDLYLLCRTTGVPCPEAIFPHCAVDVHEFIRRVTFPVVIKAKEPARLPKNARPTYIAQSPEELLAIYRRLESPHEPNLIFQEYIPESVAEDWIFHGYSNPESKCLVGFTGKKLRSWPPFTGITTLGVSVVNEPLRLQTEQLLKAVGYAGIVDLDYRLDKRDGKYKLLDFNPRVGANFRMFEDLAGIDVVRALHLDLTGRRFTALPMVERTFIVESYDPFATFTYMRRGRLTVGAWRQSLQRPREFGWFDRRDPLPFLFMWVRLLSQTVGRAVQKSRQQFGTSREGRPGAIKVSAVEGPRVMESELRPDPAGSLRGDESGALLTDRVSD